MMKDATGISYSDADAVIYVDGNSGSSVGNFRSWFSMNLDQFNIDSLDIDLLDID